MTALQTTLGSTDTVSKRFDPVPRGENALPTPVEMFVVDSPQDPLWLTDAGAAEFWRRLAVLVFEDFQVLDHISSVDIRQPPGLLELAFFSLVLPPRHNQPVVTSAEPPPAADLSASLCDLEGAAEEAREEGFPQPSPLALKNARRLLQDLYRLRPSRLEAYPTPDGEIALVTPGGRGQSVLLLCDSDGGALCSVNLNGQHRRARYSDATMLPDGFVREALGELDEPAQTS